MRLAIICMAWSWPTTRCCQGGRQFDSARSVWLASIRPIGMPVQSCTTEADSKLVDGRQDERCFALLGDELRPSDHAGLPSASSRSKGFFGFRFGRWFGGRCRQQESADKSCGSASCLGIFRCSFRRLCRCGRFGFQRGVAHTCGFINRMRRCRAACGAGYRGFPKPVPFRLPIVRIAGVQRGLGAGRAMPRPRPCVRSRRCRWPLRAR